MRQVLLLAVVVSAVAALPSLWSRVQSAAVKGKLMCNGKPATDVKVKLYDVDTTDLDDLMAEGVSDASGAFFLSGTESERTTIDPKVNIYHKCNHEGICMKKIAIIIPKTFVSEGEKPAKTFDIGEINLAGSFSGESTDCIN